MFKRKDLKQFSKQQLADELKKRSEADKIFLSRDGDVHDLADDVAKFYDDQREKGRSTDEIEIQGQLLLQLNKNYH